MSDTEIKESEDSGLPWWAWLLGAMIVAGLIWWAATGMTADRTAEVAPADTSVSAGTPSSAGTPGEVGTPEAATPGDVVAVTGPEITDITELVGTVDAASLVGRPVALTDAPVQAAGDGKVFWIGPDFDRQLLVITDANATVGDDVNGAAQRATLNIAGQIREFTNLDEAKQQYNLDSDAMAFLTEKKMYLHASKVTAGST